MGHKALCGKALSQQSFRQQASLLKRGGMWVMLSLSSLSAICVGLLPAMAAELSAWRYDARSRSLTLTLPGSVTPQISVTAPNQLLVELPDTQIGDVQGRQVNDGFVERIALEQATPETLWMVVDFVPGTVLAETQQVTPLAASSNMLQLWKVEPTLLASRRVVEAAVATSRTTPAEAASPGAGASDLAVDGPSIGRAAIAQADLPDLPVLEPAVPLAQPVSVPPIDTSLDDAPAGSVPKVATGRVPRVSVPELERSPIQADDAPINVPVVVEPAMDEPAVPTASPAQPPFLGGIDVEVVETMPVQPPAAVAVEPEISVTEPSAFGAPTVDVSAERVNTQNTTSRWPEPIPFGQPLP